MIDIKNNNNVLEIINAILNNGGIAEIKNEGNPNKENVVVVEIKRQVRTTKKPK